MMPSTEEELLVAEEELLTADEVAALLKVGKKWVYGAVRRGKFPHVKVGRYVRFSKVQVDEWIRAGGEA